ncbi:hypothetical protein M8J76_016751 [Diaphorina citri]|nr:hypothetical protein M8J76_016751 [Diaphorina citri]
MVSEIPDEICEGADVLSAFVMIDGKEEKIDSFCGNKLPRPLMSNGPRLVLEFKGIYSSRFSRGFQAVYTFTENFGINTGHQLSELPCAFMFNSTGGHRNGTFTSPNFPGLYPRDTECHYFFYGRNDERIKLDFDGGISACGGVAIYLRNNIYYEELTIQTRLQVVAIRASIPYPVSICNLYLPDQNTDKSEVLQVLNQLPRPFLMLGDLNAHNSLWGSVSRNNNGKIIEEILLSDSHLLLNTYGIPTHFNFTSRTESVIDLALADSSLATKVLWSADEELHGSDHYPIYLKINTPKEKSSLNPKWRFHKADWNKFAGNVSFESVMEENSTLNADQIMQNINDEILLAAKMSIPQSKPSKGISGNEEVDVLAKQTVTDQSVPCITNLLQTVDLQCHIQRQIKNIWKREWQQNVNNKLFQIKPELGEWKSSYNRKRTLETALARIRLGHTNLTHVYLIKREEPPLCSCGQRLTVQHIIIECPTLVALRNSIFGSSRQITLSEVLKDSPADTKKVEHLPRGATFMFNSEALGFIVCIEYGPVLVLHESRVVFKRCEARTASDYIEFSNYMARDRKFPRYCGYISPFEVTSDQKFFRLTFRSNDRLDGTGFNASYYFIEETNTMSSSMKPTLSSTSSSNSVSVSILLSISLLCLVILLPHADL